MFSVLPSVKNKSISSQSDGCTVAQDVEINLSSQTNKKEIYSTWVDTLKSSAYSHVPLL